MNLSLRFRSSQRLRRPARTSGCWLLYSRPWSVLGLNRILAWEIQTIDPDFVTL
ncbi:MAG: hypothetical protein HC814_00025 [Rhodobacteraceae bacterium]|nr:hypothetical protein [Paracoccaceae bacterium]